MRRSLLAASSALSLLLMAPAALALSVGTVDTARVLATYKGAQSAQAQMQKELQAYQQEFTERQRKIQQASKEGKSQAEIQKMTEQYERELAPIKQKAANLEKKLAVEVKSKVEAKIHQIARDRHVEVVLDKAAVLHGGMDLTDDVIRSLR